MNEFRERIWELLVGLVKHAETALPGASGKEKKAQVVEWVAQMVNMGESLTPLAKWANLPAVDAFERFIIGLGVEWAWTQLQLPADQQHPVAHSPEVLPLSA